jgi:hypothetical protein
MEAVMLAALAQVRPAFAIGLFWSLATLAAAMGIQTATLTGIGPLTAHTTFVTGMINKLAALESSKRRSSRQSEARSRAGSFPFCGLVLLCRKRRDWNLDLLFSAHASIIHCSRSAARQFGHRPVLSTLHQRRKRAVEGLKARYRNQQLIFLFLARRV